MRTNDNLVTAGQRKKIEAQARQALERANAIGVYPTPIDEVYHAAKVTIANDEIFDDGFLARFRKKASGALKSAIEKVLGLFDAKSNVVFLDHTVQGARKVFLKLHELGHAMLPWQKNIYAVIEDCEKTISPEVSDEFDREANVFATEVLFQLDAFMNEANKHDFDIKIPLALSKKFGSSAYASIRRYVFKNSHPCAVIVLNPASLIIGDGFKAEIRRVETSESFELSFGKIEWPSFVTPDDSIGEMIPMGSRRMSGKREIGLKDANGDIRECIAEAFKTPYQTFVLVIDSKKLKKKIFT